MNKMALQTLQYFLMSKAVLLSFIITGTQGIQFSATGGVYKTSHIETTSMDADPLSFVSEPPSGIVVDTGCTDASGVPVPAVYSITRALSGSNDSIDLFEMDRQNGTVTWSSNATLDYEESPLLLIEIECVDSTNSDNVTTAIINVTVLSVNEYLPVVNDPPNSIVITELEPIGSILFSTRHSDNPHAIYNVSDRDRGSDGEITYTLRSIEFDVRQVSVSVNSNSGAITLTDVIDLDTISEGILFFQFRLTACDRRSDQDHCPNILFRITYTAGPDNDPAFNVNSLKFSFFENTTNGTVLAQLTCHDRDIHQVGIFQGIKISDSYPVEVFRVNVVEETGIVILNGSLDYERSPLYNVTLECFDNSEPPVSDYAVITINVEPLNDEAPQFEQSLYSFVIERIGPSGEDIGRVVATDLDQGPDGQITYSIISGDINNFGIRPEGVIYLKDFVFSSEGESFNLIVLASDGELNNTAMVTITVSGFISIPELVIIVVTATVFIFIVVIIVIIVLICCCKCIPSRKVHKSDSEKTLSEKHDETDFGGIPYPVPVAVPVPVPYHPGMVEHNEMYKSGQNWNQSQESINSTQNDDGGDLTSNKSALSFGPVLQGVMEHFHEGEKIISKKKKTEVSAE